MSSYGIDPDVAVEIVEELVVDQGEVVWSLDCEVDNMNGSTMSFVYKFHDLYWPSAEDLGVDGPYETLDECAQTVIGECGRYAVWAKDLPAAEIVKRLLLDPPGERLVTVNGEKWFFDPKLEAFRPATEEEIDEFDYLD